MRVARSAGVGALQIGSEIERNFYRLRVAAKGLHGPH